MQTTTLLLIALIAIIVFYMFQQQRQPVLYNTWPVTWNQDWGGGFGYDRHRIMRDNHHHYGSPRAPPKHRGL